MKFRKLIPSYWPILFLLFVSLAFSWKFFFKGLIPVPADVTVGIYYPWRDYIWNDFIAGVPYKNGLLSDVVSIIYPWRIYGMELIKNFKAPLWIPFTLAGSPLAANFQSGMFYPLNFLFFLFSNVNAWSIYILLQPFLASVFLYLYLRNLKLGKFASALGGLIFGFCGFMTVWLEYGVVGHAGLWLPLMLLVVDKVKSKNYFYWLLAGSFFVAFSVLAGYPQLTIYAIAFLASYTLFRLVTERDKKYLLIILPVFLGIMLSAVQLFPGAELLPHSVRQSDPTTQSFSFGAIPVKSLINLIAPDFYGNPSTGNYWGWATYNESAAYVGIIGLFLALFALITARSRESKFYKLALLTGLLFAFQTPLAYLPSRLGIPGLSAAVAGRMLFVVDFSLAILASFGLEEVLSRKNGRKVLTVTCLLGLVYLLVWLAVFIVSRVIPIDSKTLVNFSILTRNLILPVLIFVCLQFILVLNYTNWLKSKTLPALMILFLLTFDLVRFGQKYNPFVSRNYLYPQTEMTDYLKKEGGLFRFVGLFPSSMWVPYQLYGLNGYDPMMIERYGEFANQIDTLPGSDFTVTSRWINVQNFSSNLLDLLGVKYATFFRGEPKSDWDPDPWYAKHGFNMVFQKGKSQIYESTEYFPRAFIVHNFVVEKDRQKIIDTLKDPKFDLANTVVLEEVPALTMTKADGPEESKIDEEAYPFNDFVVNVKATAPGLLFLSDTYFPGWKASLDGSPVKIYRANYTFRAVEVPTGEHKIRFTYEPVSFVLGKTVSLTSFLFCVLLLVGYLLKEKITGRKDTRSLLFAKKVYERYTKKHEQNKRYSKKHKRILKD